MISLCKEYMIYLTGFQVVTCWLVGGVSLALKE